MNGLRQIPATHWEPSSHWPSPLHEAPLAIRAVQMSFIAQYAPEPQPAVAHDAPRSTLLGAQAPFSQRKLAQSDWLPQASPRTRAGAHCPPAQMSPLLHRS